MSKFQTTNILKSKSVKSLSAIFVLGVLTIALSLYGSGDKKIGESDTGRQIGNSQEVAGTVEQVAQEILEQVINVNGGYDVESDLGSQDSSLALKANQDIAKFGTTTKDQKLFKVLEVVDGDTIKVSELGTLRLVGMDTPETKDPRKPVQCFGLEASNKAKELLNGQSVYLEFDPANRIDKYGRTLAYVFREDNLFFNGEMIKQGYAHSYTKYPHPKMEEFNLYQKEAVQENRGLWSPLTCSGDTTVAVQGQGVSSSKSASIKVSSSNTSGSGSQYIAGSCAYLKSLGLGNFEPGNPNYTLERDGNRDGVACE